MKTSLFTLVIEDNVPTLKALDASVSDVVTIFGKQYWLVPVVRETVAAPAPARKKNGAAEAFSRFDPAIQARAIELGRAGMPLGQIMKELGSHDYHAVQRWLRGAGIETNVDRAKRLIKEAILDAGEAGCAPAVVGKIAYENNTQAGPQLLGMMRSKTIKRLVNGNWVMR